MEQAYGEPLSYSELLERQRLQKNGLDPENTLFRVGRNKVFLIPTWAFPKELLESNVLRKNGDETVVVDANPEQPLEYLTLAIVNANMFIKQLQDENTSLQIKANMQAPDGDRLMAIYERLGSFASRLLTVESRVDEVDSKIENLEGDMEGFKDWDDEPDI